MRFFLILLLLFIFISCDQDRKVSFLNDYNSHRILASNDDFDCYVDNFTLDFIIKDIKLLESDIEEIKLKEDKYDYLTLTNGQKKYLNDHSELIDFKEGSSDCSDFYCLLNTNYENKTKEEAYRIYHYYLKTGIALDTNAKVPVWNASAGRRDLVKREGDVNDYLFDNDQLKTLNISSYVQADKYLQLSVSSIHRTKKDHYIDSSPDGRSFTTGYFYSSRPTVTGIKFRHKKGHIYISDQSVAFSNKIISGGFARTLYHELTHALDYTFGKKRAFNGLSEQFDWYDFSWERDDLSSESTLSSNLVIKKDKKNFVRNYAKESVKEDFADHGAYYLQSPKELKKVAPNKYKYFKENIYNKKVYDFDSYINLKKESLKELLSSKVFDFIASCERETEVNYQGEHFLSNLPDSIFVRCLEKEIQNFLLVQSLKTKKEEYLGCAVYKLRAGDIEDYAKEYVALKLTEVLEKHNSFQELNKEIEIYRERISQVCPADYFLLQVPKPDETEFLGELRTCLESVTTNLDPYLTKQEIDSFIGTHNYNELNSAIDSYLIRDLEKVKLNSDGFIAELVESCDVGFSDVTREISPLNISFLSLNTDFNNCLNSSFDIKANDYIKKSFSYDESKYEDIFNLFRDQAMSVITTSLFKILEVKNQAEVRSLSEFNHFELEDKYLGQKMISKLISASTNKFESCYESMRPIMLKDYQTLFLEKKIKTLEVNDYVNYYISALCNKVKNINSQAQLETLQVEKEAIKKIGSEMNFLYELDIKVSDIVFYKQEYLESCEKQSFSTHKQFKSIPGTVANLCLNKWGEYEQSVLSDFYKKVECGSTCFKALKKSDIYKSFSSKLNLFLENKVNQVKSLCDKQEDTKACLRIKVFNNENKQAYAEEVVLDLNPKLSEFTKSEFYKLFFMMSIK